MKYLILLDVGGTSIKSAVMSESGELLGEVQKYSSQSRENKDTIIKNLVEIIEKTVVQIPEDNFEILGIGLAFPGPFNYQEGISYIKNLDKYMAIYNINIKRELGQQIKQSSLKDKVKKETSIFFMNDVEAFAYGEYNFGAAKNSFKSCFLCIGTGAGSAFIKKGKILKNADNIPENGWVYNLPFKGSIIDDYVSARGLEKLAYNNFAETKTGIELFGLAKAGDETAITTFEDFGENLNDAMLPILKTFCPEYFVLGGEISKSFEFFGDEIKKSLQKTNIKLSLSRDTSVSTIKGLYVYYKSVLRSFEVE